MNLWYFYAAEESVKLLKSKGFVNLEIYGEKVKSEV